MNIKKTIRYILSAALAFALLWFSFREVEWGDFLAGLKECRWGWVLLSMASGSFAFWLRALRWHQLLHPIDSNVTRLTAFNGINIGNISNFVFPRISEFVRCGVITRRSKITYDKVLGTVVLERGWELLVMLLLLAVVLVFGFERFGQFFVERIWEPMALRLGGNIWWAVLALSLICMAGIYMVWRLRSANPFCLKVWNVFRGIVQGFSSCLRMDRKWLFFAYTALIWLTYWSMAAATVKAAPFLDSLDLVDALFLSLVGGLGFAVPVPGGIGAFHFIISMTLSVMYGVPVELGVVYATLSHTSQAITQIVFGLGSYVCEAFRK
jgi:uncharacterized membrane protein YbhN (UPF0104 family)